MWFSNWFRERKKKPPLPEEKVRILAVSMLLEEGFQLERTARRHGWEVTFADSPREGFALASQGHFGVILCDTIQRAYPWREVMDRLIAASPRSCILLVSPVKDDALWGDVIQQGGYDVLVRPLREESLLLAIDAAVRFISPGACVGAG